jgi:crotonobetainyl-CoA:carnitine CoA-transferase CaiB-like acyl-CoA transferase
MSTPALLEGIRVLEIGNAITGSVAGKLLRDAGAEVAKAPLRPLTGEPDHVLAAFAMWDHGKRIINDDRSIREMLVEADIVIDQQWCAGRERVLNELERARERESLIYCSLASGLAFAVDGLHIGDFEALIGAASGVFSSAVSGQALDGVAYIDVPIASVAAAIHVVTASAAALTRRPAGQRISITLTHVPAFQKGVEFSRSEHLQTVRGTQMAASGMFRAGDGRWIQLDAPSARITTRLWGALRDAKMPTDGLDALNKPLSAVTAEEAAQIKTALTALFARQSAREWERLLSAGDVPCGMCQQPEEWLYSERALASGAVALYRDALGAPPRRGVGQMVR